MFCYTLALSFCSWIVGPYFFGCILVSTFYCCIIPAALPISLNEHMPILCLLGFNVIFLVLAPLHYEHNICIICFFQTIVIALTYLSGFLGRGIESLRPIFYFRQVGNLVWKPRFISYPGLEPIAGNFFMYIEHNECDCSHIWLCSVRNMVFVNSCKCIFQSNFTLSFSTRNEHDYDI